MTVREARRLIELDGWYQVRQRGSHRVYRHRQKQGVVVIAGAPGKDVPKGTLNVILKSAGLKED